ncbi:hypothetical protein SADUNF_Sadunf04G0119900 [Salix dunnii]|uniref:Uncharacterized protein n=1 Tax=Salix dunnii TaxID=1413687 RepID=A0A835N105_9ROSI|nr:hypothetical protein SADUNF_Sadunf04G0119900 [Salix dunnii]
MRYVNDEVPGVISLITIVRISHVRSLVFKLDALAVKAPWKRTGGRTTAIQFWPMKMTKALLGYIPNDCGRNWLLNSCHRCDHWFFVHRISNIIPGQLNFPECVPLYRSDAFSSTKLEIHFKAACFVLQT